MTDLQRLSGDLAAVQPAPVQPAGSAPPVRAGFKTLRKPVFSPTHSSVLYLVTFTCYGSHLPGDPRGSFDHMRAGGRRFLPASRNLESYHRRRMRQPEHLLATPRARAIVRDAIVSVCLHRSWFLHALHVRTNHVHGIVDAGCLPSRIINDWKAYATRCLRMAGEATSTRILWTHGASARRIWTREALTRALDYVLNGQGEPLAGYSASPQPNP